MHTWILKDECVATYIVPMKQIMHLIKCRYTVLYEGEWEYQN